jgi:hypothetical protein
LGLGLGVGVGVRVGAMVGVRVGAKVRILGWFVHADLVLHLPVSSK